MVAVCPAYVTTNTERRTSPETQSKIGITETSRHRYGPEILIRLDDQCEAVLVVEPLGNVVHPDAAVVTAGVGWDFDPVATDSVRIPIIVPDVHQGRKEEKHSPVECVCRVVEEADVCPRGAKLALDT